MATVGTRRFHLHSGGEKTLSTDSCRNPTIDVASFENSGGNVMVGTPGRIADVFRRSSQVDPRQLELLVLDEADRLLDLGFKEQLDFIFGRLPRQRRTGGTLSSPIFRQCSPTQSSSG